MKPNLLAGIMCLVLPLAVFAADGALSNKWEYSLINPVPRDEMRPLFSSIQDGVMDARTLDAGHVQVEGEFVDYFYNSSTPPTYYSDEFLWAPRVTVGLLNDLDFEVRPTYEIRYFDYQRASSEFGRVAAGVKVNLLGNDDGMIAVALSPYLSIPTSRTDAIGGGDLLGGGDVAVLVRLPHELSVKVDSECYASQRRSDNEIFAGFYNALSLDKTLCSKADAYCYFATTVTTDPTQTWYGYAGLGLQYNVTRDLQVFAGMGFGVTPDWTQGQTRAYDYNPRAGLVWRY